MSKISCPSCNKEYNLDSKFDGKKVKCISCKNIFIAYLSEDNTNKGEEKIIDKNEKESYIKEEDIKLKPNKLSYILLGSPILFFVIITLLSFIISPLVGIMFLILSLIIYFIINIKYNKEEYIITDRKIIYNYGTIFSDNSVEINLNKVTQVISILGFIQNKIFGTGNLVIKTAGSSSSKINLKNIDKTMFFYENIQNRMKKNGFHLKKDKLVQTAKPHFLGIIGEIFQKIAYSVFGAILMVGALPEGFSFFGILIFLVVLLIVIFSYLDLKVREYNIYTDSIFYTEGFLTKYYSFLPMESVADTENTQSFFSKIFGLHDIVVSSEGSNNRVIFKNMPNGEKMMNNIKYLKDNIIMGEKDILVGEEKSVNSLIGFKDKIEIPLDYDKDFKAEYKMDLLKSLVIVLFPAAILAIGMIFFSQEIFVGGVLSILPYVIAISIVQIIRVKFTRYIVESSSIEKKFEFLSNKHNSFSVEKITGVIIKQSILDRIFGTCSIIFWSIGSSTNITFSDVKKDNNLEERILAKVGIKLNEEAKDIEIDFNILNYIKSSIGFTLIFFILFFIFFVVSLFINEISVYILIIIMGIFLLFFGLIYIYKIFYYSKSIYIQKEHKNFLESISGIIFVKKYYTLFRNIKGITTNKYPLTDTGNLNINVAGEQIVQTKNKQKMTILSNSINISFVKNIFQIHNELDNILNSNNKIDETLISESTQDVGNSILGISILFILTFYSGFLFLYMGFNIFGFFLRLTTFGEHIQKSFASIVNTISLIGLLISFLIIIGLIVWIIKVKKYRFEKDRVLYISGIIYKKRQTILYNKFNFIEKNTGFINKIFNNGIIKIYTIGSGKVEMKISDISNFEDIYNLLKKD